MIVTEKIMQQRPQAWFVVEISASLSEKVVSKLRAPFVNAKWVLCLANKHHEAVNENYHITHTVWT